jgi:hypothetical protein
MEDYLMHRITSFIRDIFFRMLRAFLIWGIIAGVASFGFIYLTSRHAPIIAEWVLIGVVTITAALLGTVSALAWELTHIPHILRLARGQHSKHEERMAISASAQKRPADDQ